MKAASTKNSSSSSKLGMKAATKQTPRKTPKPTTATLIDKFAAQCGKCTKWRYIDSQEEYESIRSVTPNMVFECMRCDEIGDVDVNNDSTRIWFLDGYIPKTPKGFKRISLVRANCEKVDVYYVTPKGKKLKTRNDVAKFIQDNEEVKGTQMEDISFITPKPLKKTTK